MPRNIALLHIVASMGELCFKAGLKNNVDWHLACAAIELQRICMDMVVGIFSSMSLKVLMCPGPAATFNVTHRQSCS